MGWPTAGPGVKTLVGHVSSNFARELGVQSKSSAFLRLSVYDEYQVCIHMVIILSIPSQNLDDSVRMPVIHIQMANDNFEYSAREPGAGRGEPAWWR